MQIAQEKYGLEPQMLKALFEESFEQAEELVKIIGH
jgi:hypothetical protein|tara:strand:- start:175 stop:282 length:108 start_codon:yes stop_codon:yes gene_type:complete